MKNMLRKAKNKTAKAFGDFWFFASELLLAIFIWIAIAAAIFAMGIGAATILLTPES